MHSSPHTLLRTFPLALTTRQCSPPSQCATQPSTASRRQSYFPRSQNSVINTAQLPNEPQAAPSPTCQKANPCAATLPLTGAAVSYDLSKPSHCESHCESQPANSSSSSTSWKLRGCLLHPALAVTLQPLHRMRVHDVPLADSLLHSAYSVHTVRDGGAFRSGPLTMSRTRALVPLLQDDPLVGPLTHCACRSPKELPDKYL